MVAPALDLAFISIAEARDLFRSRALSPVELTLAQLERIERLQPSMRAYITVTAETALAEARQAEACYLRGEDASAMLGIPVAYKDIYMTAGVRTTGGSRVLEHWVPDITATTVQKLHDAGAVMLGKLSTHEFATAITAEDSPFPPARNPWKEGHIPGGSSSGSGTALAAGMTLGTLGTDTGGSIRHPGCNCGIAALKPTYGRCSRYGVLALSWSLDHTGPMARTVEDAAIMLNAMAGYDPMDSASANVPVEDFTAGLDLGVKGLRIGVPRETFMDTVSAPVLAAVEAALDEYRRLGAEVADVAIPNLDLQRASAVISMAEAYVYHAPDLAEKPDLYPEMLRNRYRSGALYLAHEYINAQRARQIVKQSVREAMRDVDVLIGPTRGRTAMTYAEAYEAYGRPPSYTSLHNLTGLPAISIPCGFSEDGLPMGLQIAGRPFDETTVLRVAHAYEREAGWYLRHPVV